jgi:hypothetical protein
MLLVRVLSEELQKTGLDLCFVTLSYCCLIICYTLPSHEYIFLIDIILYLCRYGWFVLVWR